MSPSGSQGNRTIAPPVINANIAKFMRGREAPVVRRSSQGWRLICEDCEWRRRSPKLFQAAGSLLAGAIRPQSGRRGAVGQSLAELPEPDRARSTPAAGPGHAPPVCVVRGRASHFGDGEVWRQAHDLPGGDRRSPLRRRRRDFGRRRTRLPRRPPEVARRFLAFTSLSRPGRGAADDPRGIRSRCGGHCWPTTPSAPYDEVRDWGSRTGTTSTRSTGPRKACLKRRASSAVPCGRISPAG